MAPHLLSPAPGLAWVHAGPHNLAVITVELNSNEKTKGPAANRGQLNEVAGLGSCAETHLQTQAATRVPRGSSPCISSPYALGLVENA